MISASVCDDPDYRKLACPYCGRQVALHLGSRQHQCNCHRGCGRDFLGRRSTARRTVSERSPLQTGGGVVMRDNDADRYLVTVAGKQTRVTTDDLTNAKTMAAGMAAGRSIAAGGLTWLTRRGAARDGARSRRHAHDERERRGVACDGETGMRTISTLFCGDRRLRGAAARWHGMRTVGFCEIDPWCRRVIAKNFPGVPIHADIRTLTGAIVRTWLERRTLTTDGLYTTPTSDTAIRTKRYAQGGTALGHAGLDLITGGYPCQPFSVAGNRLGTEDDRALGRRCVGSLGTPTRWGPG